MANLNYVLLERVTVGETAVSSITFNSIPQTGYTDLKIVASARTSASAIQQAVTIQLNALTTGYSNRYLYGSGSVAGSGTYSTSIGFVGDTPAATATASTFSNQEIYIPNYTSSNAKSWSVDSVAETNGAAAYMELTANSNSTTAAITSITLAPAANTFIQYSSFSLYGLAAVGTTPTKAPKATGGSIIQTDGTYWYHAFLASGTFTPAVGLSCDVLVVAGGGGGGNNYGGGGGAGGVFELSAQALAATGYTVTIGAGGAGSTSNSIIGTVGVNSQFGALTAGVGGGGGGSLLSSNGGAGGSGGGGATTLFSAGGAGGTPTSGQGTVGGVGNTGSYAAGGGGAGVAGATGSSASSGTGGAGGAGLNTWSSWASATSTGVSGYYGGGGGGTGGPSGIAGTGGAGGGAAGGASGAAASAAANTGGGGGGGANASPNTGGKGGSGIVIVRYLA